MRDDVGDAAEEPWDTVLAEEAAMAPADFSRWFGAGWRAAPLTGLLPWSPDRTTTPWCLSGAPVQLMLRAGQGIVEVAIPAGVWEHGTHGLVWLPHEIETVDVRAADEEVVVAAVTRLLRRRRAGFRYCRYCRDLTPPEQRFEPDVCMACASRWLGVAY